MRISWIRLAVFAGVASLGLAAATVPLAAQRGAAAPSKLMDPAQLSEKAPDVFKAKFDTSKGVFVIEVQREWAPIGADRFYNLVKNGFYDDIRFFRVLPGFMAQFGINGRPPVQAIWREQNIKDEPVKQSNKKGFITYAKSGAPNSRSTQVFINFEDNTQLDRQGFAPFGKVISGMEVVLKLNPEYGEGSPSGNGPDQGRMQREGNVYLSKEYPRLDFIRKATIEP